MHLRRFFLYSLLALSLCLAALPARAAPAQTASPGELIAAVNELRAGRGLNTLNADPILMGIAQAHAEYLAGNGLMTHLGANGSRPFQRALNAGFPVWGDLSLGGYFSENIMGGSSFSAADVIEVWMGDEPHQNTMLSPNRSDMGAGVAVGSDGNAVFVIDTGLRGPDGIIQKWATQTAGETGGGSAGSSSGSSSAPPLAYSYATNTPDPDGAIYHIVQTGQTLWVIAARYSLSVEQLAALNPETNPQFLRIGERLLVLPAPTLTPTVLAAGDAQRDTAPTPSRTPRPTRVLQNSPAPGPSLTPAPSAAPALAAPLIPPALQSIAWLVVLLLGLALGVYLWAALHK